jgi:serine/threonine protein kinase
MDTVTKEKEPLLADDEMRKRKKDQDETGNIIQGLIRLLTFLANILTADDPKEFYSNWHQVGDGAFGIVQAAQDLATGRMVAVKLVRRSYLEHKERILNEIYILRTCNHPNIVSYVRSFIYKDYVSIVTEFCDAGSIRGLVPLGLKEDMIIYIIYYVMQGLAYMHNHNRIHRDIKSSNVLLTTGGEIKICKFKDVID